MSIKLGLTFFSFCCWTTWAFLGAMILPSQIIIIIKLSTCFFWWLKVLISNACNSPAGYDQDWKCFVSKNDTLDKNSISWMKSEFLMCDWAFTQQRSHHSSGECSFQLVAFIATHLWYVLTQIVLIKEKLQHLFHLCHIVSLLCLNVSHSLHGRSFS